MQREREKLSRSQIRFPTQFSGRGMMLLERCLACARYNAISAFFFLLPGRRSARREIFRGIGGRLPREGSRFASLRSISKAGTNDRAAKPLHLITRSILSMQLARHSFALDSIAKSLLCVAIPGSNRILGAANLSRWITNYVNRKNWDL